MYERFLAEDVNPAFNRLANHARMQMRRRGDDDGPRLLLVEESRQIFVGVHAGVLAEDVQQVPGGVADTHQVDVRMRPGD